MPKHIPATPPPAAHFGGEEWRDIDTAPDHYNPADHDEVLRVARAGIREHRMGDLTVRLVDRQGRPLAGLPVKFIQQTSDFAVGDNLWGLDRYWRNGTFDGSLAQAQRARFTELFNAAN